MKIAVIGSGYVGLVAATCFAEIGHQVVCVDNDPQKLAALEGGETPIHEQFLPELIARHRNRKLTFSGSLHDAVAASQAVFIAVGTPSSTSGEADLSYVEAVAREIAGALNGYKVIVEKSTVPVFTNEWICRVLLLNGADEDHFAVLSNPEFLREGTAVTDFLYPDRIVVGANTQRARTIMRAIYEPIVSGEYRVANDRVPEPTGSAAQALYIETSAQSAELIKHASNAFLAMKISFINAVASICESVGADIDEVVQGVGTDSRIGKRFLRAGIGYGGSCFPKDVSAFRAVARDAGYDFRLLDEVCRINEEQRDRYLKKVREALWTLKGKRIAALGLAFKGGTDDVRESPAVAVIEALQREGCTVVAYDPAAMDRIHEVLPSVQTAESPQEAIKGADALLVLTDWKEFSDLDLQQVKRDLHYPIVIDGRNMFHPEAVAAAGLNYYSVGRAHKAAEKIVAAKSPAEK